MKKSVLKIALFALALVVAFILTSCGKAPQAPQREIKFKGTVVADTQNCLLEIKGIEIKENDCSIELLFKNKSKDRMYCFDITEAYIDGLACEFDYSTGVESGKTETFKIPVTDKAFKENYSGAFNHLELRFYVYDNLDYTEEFDDVAHIYTYGEVKPPIYEREYSAEDKTIIDKDGIKVSVIGHSYDPEWSYSAKLYIENNTDRNIQISSSGTRINDELINTYFSKTIAGQKNKYTEIWWQKEDLEKLGIKSEEDIKTIVSRIVVQENGEGAEILADEYVNLKP